MEKRGKGINPVVFWSIIFFVLIIVAVIVFFFTNSLQIMKIQQEQIGSSEVNILINDFKERVGGVDFTLEVNAKKKEITKVKFIFYSVDNKTEIYEKDVSYVCKHKDFFSINLYKMHPSQVRKVLIESNVSDLREEFACLPEVNVSDSWYRSKNFMEKIFSKIQGN